MCISMLFLSIGCSNNASADNNETKDKNITINEKDRELWQKSVEIYLKDNLWLENESYDAGHFLMIPLHAAFQFNEPLWQQQFSNQFIRFVDEGYNQSFNNTVLSQSRAQYLYLASQFLVLAKESGKQLLIPEGLEDLIYQELEKSWTGKADIDGENTKQIDSVKNQIEKKLNSKDTYLAKRFIGDLYHFLFVIAADMKKYETLNEEDSQYSPLISDILDTGYKVYKQGIVFQADGGWLYQPGFLSDHPDYAYAGNLVKAVGMEPKKVPGIAEDSSHSHRFPLWITSLADAYKDGDERRAYYTNLKEGLDKQFFQHVIVKPTKDFSTYRTNNFMDGNNGVYRWGYKTQGVNKGYGPYEVSGTLALGWWTFLGSDRIKEMYTQMANQFPLPNNVITTYVGPNTTRERNPLVVLPDSYKNGIYELIVRLASKLKD